MSVAFHQAQKQKYRVTLEFEVLDDFDPHNLDWEKVFKLEPAEKVSAYVEDLSTPDRWWVGNNERVVSLCDSYLDRLKCPYSMSTTQTKMTTTYQRNALDISYNGWENYETWNVALWINNEEGLYNLAMEAGDYETLVDVLYNDYGVKETQDGVKFADSKVNVIQLNSDVFDF